MTKRLRIMHILSAPAAGGAEVYVRDLALAMAAEGHSVSVVFLNHAHEVGRQQSFEDIFLADLESVGVGFHFIGYRARRNPVFGWFRLRCLIREFCPDIIHSHLYFGLLFSALNAAPVVYTHHNIKLGLPAWVYRILLDRVVSSYVGICAACTNVLKGVSSKPVLRIDNSVSTSRVPSPVEPRSGRGKVKLFSTGRLTEQKNYFLLLDAAAQLDGLDFTLEIAGEGPLRESLERRIIERRLSDRVRLLGNVSDVPQRLADADIFVMSSAWEGLPISLLEATLAGLPVVVTNVGGCAEVPHAVGNGLVVDSLDANELAIALRRLIQSDSQRTFFAQNSLNYSTRYRLETAVALHLSMYLKLANSKRSNAAI